MNINIGILLQFLTVLLHHPVISFFHQINCHSRSGSSAEYLPGVSITESTKVQDGSVSPIVEVGNISQHNLAGTYIKIL